MATDDRGHTGDLTILQAAMSRAQARLHRSVTVTVDDHLTLVCDLPTNGLEVERLKAAAERLDKGRATGTNFARALVALCTASIEIDGSPVVLDDEVVSFRDPPLWRALGVSTSKDAVVALIGADGDIARVAARLMEEGGWGESDEDPI